MWNPIARPSPGSARAPAAPLRSARGSSSQVPRYVPGPELDAVAVGVVHVSGSAVLPAEPGPVGVDLRLQPEAPDAIDRVIEVGVRDVQSEVNVGAPTGPRESLLGEPEADPGALPGHQPDPAAIVRTCDHGQSQ